MKGILFDLKKYSIQDGPGIRTTVFFKGCPLSCRWCHNPESIKPGSETIRILDRKKCLDLSTTETIHTIGKEVDSSIVLKEIVKDLQFYADSEGGVTFSGGEPFLQPEFLWELLTLCKQEEIHTLVDTCGLVDSVTLMRTAGLIDLFYYDLKIMDSAKHIEYTGADNGLILDNLRLLVEKNQPVEIRIPLIPGITDTFENLNGIVQYLLTLKTVPLVHLLPYNTFVDSKYQKLNQTFNMKDLRRQNEATLLYMQTIFTEEGITCHIGG